MDTGMVFVYLIGFAIGGVLLFLLFRNVILWFWGINEMRESLKKMIDQNEQVLALLGKEPEPEEGVVIEAEPAVAE